MAEPETASPPPLGADNHPPQPYQSIKIEQEAEYPRNPNGADQTKSQSPESLSNSQSSPPSTTMSPPQPISSLPVIELQNISAALSAFQNSFNGLQLHLNTLKIAVDGLIANNPSQISQLAVLPAPESNSRQQSIRFDSAGVSPPASDDPINGIVGKFSTEAMEDITNVGEGGVVAKSTDISFEELKTHCETMNFRGLKRYLVMNLKDIATLRLEVPKALKYAPNPAKLVFECSGRFYLQGSKAYVKGSPMVTGREASVLILECFILMEGGGNESRVTEDVKEEADRAAMLWRKRIISEGGILTACEIDARGLLLLMGCYGVPQLFKNEDVRDLLRAGHVREIAGTLRRSSALMAIVPEIIEGMLKNNLEVDAIDVAYTFGFEEKCNVQTILTSLLQKIKEPSKKGKKSSLPPAAVNDANRKQLALLKSFVKCLEGHNIDSSKINSIKQAHEKISSLEKDISEYDKKMGAEKTHKRKAEAMAGRRSKFQEGKRSRYTGQGLQHPKVGHNSQRSLLDSGMAVHMNGYSASQPMLHAQVAGTGYAAPGAYGGMVVDPSGHVVNHGVQPYGWHGDPTLTERVVTHSYAAQLSSSSMSSLYRPSSSSLEGYVMHTSGSSIAVPNRSATTDLYQFADTIVDNEYHPPVVSSNHTSYQY